MIYMCIGDSHIVMLDSSNFEMMKQGRPAKTPDGEVIVGWAPDLGWLAGQIAKCDGKVETIVNLIAESLKLPEKPLDPGIGVVRLSDAENIIKKRFEEQRQGTAKRSYPEGRIGPDDDGELAAKMSVDMRHRKILIEFGKGVTWLAMGADQARELAKQLTGAAQKLEGVK